MPSALHLSQFNVGVCNAEVEMWMRWRRRRRKTGRVREGGRSIPRRRWSRRRREYRGEKTDTQLPYGLAWTLWKKRRRRDEGGLWVPQGPTPLLPPPLPLSHESFAAPLMLPPFPLLYGNGSAFCTVDTVLNKADNSNNKEPNTRITFSQTTRQRGCDGWRNGGGEDKKGACWKRIGMHVNCYRTVFRFVSFELKYVDPLAHFSLKT